MRIALLSPEYVTEDTFDGGLANYTHRLALSLRALGHEPTVFLPHGVSETFVHDNTQVHRVAWSNVQMEGAPFLRTVARLTGSVPERFRLTCQLLRRSTGMRNAVLREHALRPFDCMHAAHLGGLSAVRSHVIPTIVRISSVTRLWHAYGGFGESSAEIRQQEYVERIALRRADAVFGPSRHIADIVSRDIRRDITVIESPYIRDVEATNDRIVREHLAGKTYVLFFGSIGHLKGVGTISRMIHRLLSRHTDLYFVFVGKEVAGQAGGPLLAQLLRNAGTCADRVLHFSAMPHASLYPIIEGAQCVILPSLIDNFPNACIESMALRKIVVGTRGHSLEALIRHGENGFLIAPDNAEELLAVTEMILRLDHRKRDRIAELAVESIERLRPEITVEKLLAFYRQVCEKKHCPRSVFSA